MEGYAHAHAPICASIPLSLTQPPTSYLVSQIIFNVIGFACFWLPVQSGERAGLAITAMLSAVAADLVVVAKLPSASELTWLQKFGIFSQMFAAYCVLESVVVAYFFYLSSKSMVPSFVERMRNAGEASKDKAGGEASQHAAPPGRGPSIRFGESFMPRDADDFSHRIDAVNNEYWKKYATGIDGESFAPRHLSILPPFNCTLTDTPTQTFHASSFL